ncbi:hypothetical protein EG328_006110 [Venturia inaequalis]|uniref:Zn(2)-C6 fungal-type domain-containing protein n=2 Tax=Venturia inaequalis TaxID=5025 RepID=A0A8H3UIK8_VENIN|nr:hypothetical protein EG328_006110 [Venturia inaequalis]KAE9987118.1 hypothetical protein EG327_004016 [Venturia inaequalis]
MAGANNSLHGFGAHLGDDDDDDGAKPMPMLKGELQDDETCQSPSRKKQKRNKPTLSCLECVERKTKCDRGRPGCLACAKRQSGCRYSDIANLIAASNGSGRPTKSKRTGKQGSIASISTSAPKSPAAIGATFPAGSSLPSPVDTFIRSASSSSTLSSPFLLSNLAHTRQVTASVFGSGAHHPFANYWTTTGGVPEVIGVLPSKDQADSLVAKYFECVDPVYPMLNQQQFIAEYDRFWSMSTVERQRSDASVLALHFAVYAMGAQFIQMEFEQARAQIAEFYVSAAHQSLRLYSFLSRTSLKTVQAMVLMGYFLMNDNKATDAWAFGGILTRQAYAMGLNRDPHTMVPNASASEKQQRRKAWQAVYFQDTFLTVLLKLPPTTTFSDVKVESLTEDPADQPLINPAALLPPLSSNVMSISNIAPRHPSPILSPRHDPGRHTDVDFIRSMWRLADLVQRSVCMPRALSSPVVSSLRHKTSLLNQFRTLYATFPRSLTASHHQFAQLVMNNGRMARQNLFLRSNYWHCVMIIEAEENEMGGVHCDVRAALEAGRLALESFFDFWEHLQIEAGVWWVFQHRAFEEALTMANLLGAYHPSPSSPVLGLKHGADPVFAGSRDAIRRMLEIIEHVGSAAPEMQKTRTEVLRTAWEAIQW